VTDVFDPPVPEQRRKPSALSAPTLASIFVVLAAFLGSAVFMDSQHNVAVTGSVICNRGQSCATTPAGGHGAGGAGSPGASGMGSVSAWSVVGPGQAAGGSNPSAAQNPSASGANSDPAKSGSLALTGSEIGLLVAVALALLVAGVVLYRVSKKKAAVR
jgi:hypothetical protein